VMSNIGLEQAIDGAGGKLIRTAVGDRYVVEEMIRGGYNFGGEQSGHLIFLDHNTTGDGMISALQVLAIMRRRERPLSELAKVLTRSPQVLVNVRVRQRVDLAGIPEIGARMTEIERDLGREGRLLVRYSGTEPLVRVMIEGPDDRLIREMAETLAELVRAKLGEGTQT